MGDDESRERQDDDGPVGRLGSALEALVRQILLEQLREPVAPIETLEQMAVFGDPARLHLHPTAKVNNALFNTSSGSVTVGAFAFFGHNVSVLTGTHDVNTFGADRQDAIPSDGYDIVIGDGVWVASNSTIVGPCTIGDHAVVGVASLVLDDVDAYTIVAGHPAKAIRVIDHDEPS